MDILTHNTLSLVARFPDLPMTKLINANLHSFMGMFVLFSISSKFVLYADDYPLRCIEISLLVL
jgi:hypothetical protein